MYLMALHGNGEWVSGYHNGFFYLNRSLIKERGMNDADLRREGAEFLARMSGVSDVYTLDDIIARRAGDDPTALHRNISANHAGDLLVMVNPGWEVTDGEEYESVKTAEERAQLPVVRWQATTSPVYILSPGLDASGNHRTHRRTCHRPDPGTHTAHTFTQCCLRRPDSVNPL